MGETKEQPDTTQGVVLISGIFVTLVGLWLYSGAEGRIERFLFSAMVFTGSLNVFPQLVARLLQRK